jgi:hypothetical protein
MQVGTLSVVRRSTNTGPRRVTIILIVRVLFGAVVVRMRKWEIMRFRPTLYYLILVPAVSVYEFALRISVVLFVAHKS